MSESDVRYGSPQDDPTATDRPLPGQPVAEQPTEVIPPPGSGWRRDTVVVPPAAAADEGRSDDPLDDIAEWEDDGAVTRPEYQDTPVLVRRADNAAGLLLLVAGIAAGISLLVVWVHGGSTGLDLVRDGVAGLGDPQRLADAWEPVAVVGGGTVLFLLGLLAFVPARTHRFLGALALLVSVAVGAGVLVPLADADWDLQRWAVGAWFTAAVAGLGLLGALKALMTGPRVEWQRD